MIEQIQQASSLRFRSPDLVRFLASSLRYTPEEAANGDGLDVETLCLPPGGGAILGMSTSSYWLPKLNHLGFHRVLALFEGVMLKQSAGLITISGGELETDARAAGQLMMRLWVELNAAGLGVHPYYVVTDQLVRRRLGKVSQELEEEVKALDEGVVEAVGGALHMVLRVGYPKNDVCRSQRLPLGQVVEEL
ncbi:hypothetical protein [Aestuariirhabdus sp. LZHN29]|uniref:hypothetical protein n=1 Tax=Aestuariirhabdus sp. LZHN29 TaxID=3417462 RepID=UPI003CF4635F